MSINLDRDYSCDLSILEFTKTKNICGCFPVNSEQVTHSYVWKKLRKRIRINKSYSIIQSLSKMYRRMRGIYVYGKNMYFFCSDRKNKNWVFGTMTQLKFFQTEKNISKWKPIKFFNSLNIRLRFSTSFKITPSSCKNAGNCCFVASSLHAIGQKAALPNILYLLKFSWVHNL